MSLINDITTESMSVRLTPLNITVSVFVIVAFVFVALRASYFLGESDGRQQMPTACTGDSTAVNGIRTRTLQLQPQHRKGP